MLATPFRVLAALALVLAADTVMLARRLDPRPSLDRAAEAVGPVVRARGMEPDAELLTPQGSLRFLRTRPCGINEALRADPNRGLGWTSPVPRVLDVAVYAVATERLDDAQRRVARCGTTWRRDGDVLTWFTRNGPARLSRVGDYLVYVSAPPGDPLADEVERALREKALAQRRRPD